MPASKKIRNRVREGGHHVPEHVVHRRFASGWQNFQQVYWELVDEWILCDGTGTVPLLLDRKRNT